MLFHRFPVLFDVCWLLVQSQGAVEDPPEKEFIVCSLDLISGLSEGLGQSIESLVGASNLFQLLFVCMKVPPYPIPISSPLELCCINGISELMAFLSLWSEIVRPRSKTSTSVRMSPRAQKYHGI